ncbi:AIR synthase related protein [Klebsiella variicola subsp. variicola]|nr:AIR synthase related protein [Klebsiella variicola subsp. variicola]
MVNALWDEAQPHAAQILQGMAAASRAYQVPIVGGHTNLRSDRSQLAVAVLGETGQSAQQQRGAGRADADGRHQSAGEVAPAGK